jgi:hypothetical protein
MRKIGIKPSAAIFDDWATIKDAYRMDPADYDIFDGRYSFPHRALCFSEMGKFVGALYINRSRPTLASQI